MLGDALEWAPSSKRGWAPVTRADHDGQFVGSVHALDVKGGVGLGIALGLGLGQHLVKGLARRGHAAENEVAGAVQDAQAGVDPVGRQAVAQGAHQGDASAHRGLERYARLALAARRLEDLHPVVGQQGLVGRGHRPCP